ncbi:hypothetical protein [Peribacillus simplex]|uniref:hypothetical protein n=1 Tax=Peribacillus simplex TaxID=1478 RepID=UPI003D2E8521
MLDKFLTTDARLQAAIIAAVVTVLTLLIGTPIKHILEKKMIKHKLNLEYEYEQKKKLHDLIGEYHGRLLDSSVHLSYRIFNLYENKSKGWLSTGPSTSFYYFSSTIYRFIHLLALIRMFESKAIYIDSRIATKKDFNFIKFLKAINWTCIDVKLYEGLQYNNLANPTDHFFNDELKILCDDMIKDNELMSFEEFQKVIKKKNNKYTPVLTFFLDLDDSKLRWDRVVCLHLFLMAFINTFGYDMQKSKKQHFERALSEVKNVVILKNLDGWFPKLGLDNQKDIKIIKRILRQKGYLGTN